MAREFLGVTGPVVRGRALHAMVYEAETEFPGYPGSYYFCCPTCGNCGRHWMDPDYAVVQAAHHMFYFDHTPYLEAQDADDNGTERRTDSLPPAALLEAPDGGEPGDDLGPAA